MAPHPANPPQAPRAQAWLGRLEFQPPKPNCGGRRGGNWRWVSAGVCYFFYLHFRFFFFFLNFEGWIVFLYLLSCISLSTYSVLCTLQVRISLSTVLTIIHLFYTIPSHPTHPTPSFQTTLSNNPTPHTHPNHQPSPQSNAHPPPKNQHRNPPPPRPSQRPHPLAPAPRAAAACSGCGALCGWHGGFRGGL